MPRAHALPAIAALLADQGERERAVELYALTAREPYVTNSRWFEDVVGKHIAVHTERGIAAAILSPKRVTAAQERGPARDLDTTVRELLSELEKPQG